MLLRSGCKINLGLTITGRRADGYHELDSLFVPLPLPADTLALVPLNDDACRVRCSRGDIDPERNTLTRAYAAFRALGGRPCHGLDVTLTKRVPSGAGLGGGSANAAELLRWLNTHAAVPLSREELLAAALKVGADVPFFLYNTPCRVQGIGEIITPCALDLGGLRLVLVCPDIPVSTPWAYARYDALQDAIKNQKKVLTTSGDEDYTSHLIDRDKKHKHAGSFPSLFNSLEDVVSTAYPQVGMIRRQLEAAGAHAAMSGSGSSVFGLFEQNCPEERLSACVADLRRQWKRVFVLSLPSRWDVAKW